MESLGPIILIVASVFALGAVGLAIWLFFWGLKGAIVLYARASERGFVGVAAFIACFVFIFPVMAIISIVVGILSDLAETAQKAEWEEVGVTVRREREEREAEIARLADAAPDEE